MPQELTNAGQPLGHAGGSIKLRVICGPAQQTDSNLFAIHLNRITTIRDVWIQAEHNGDARYRHAVQPAVVKLNWQTNADSTQTIIFPKPANQKAGVKQLKLNGTTSNGLPARYYVVHGPAFVNKDTLHFTPVPRKSHYPVQVTVVAYHLRMQAGKIQHTAIPVTKSFFIYE